ncbi:uncharacterized protein LOC132060836 [Lycium ferocissimum]|uniref:uncharacterized protein LOC132060836 n=1 Tax=Lycium ferocissimum TaxID=112874 RepID=UPI002815A2C8|nr:uncharacterized protein LOC132060836 [Lycium ferocissimum]
MGDKFVCVEVETTGSSSKLILKVTGVGDGITYQELVNEIHKRCDLNCDPSKLNLKYKRRIIDRIVDDISYFPLKDDYDLRVYFRVFDERGAGPVLGVSLDDNSDVVEKVSTLDPLLYDVSNNFGVVNDHNDNDLEEQIVMADDTFFGVDTYCEDDLGVADVGEKSGDEEHDVGGETTEVGVLALDKLHSRLLALDNLDDGVTHEDDNEANDDEVLKFSDGSDLCVGKIFDGKEEVLKNLKMIAMKGKFQYKRNRFNPSLVVVACVVEGCTWRVRFKKMGTSNHFEVRTYVGYHTCGLKSAAKGHRQASYDVIAELCMSRFGCGIGPTPKELGCDVSIGGHGKQDKRQWKR